MDPTTPTRNRTARALHAVVPRRRAREAGAGEPDSATARLQCRLNRLDYRDAAGRVLATDGVFGERTFEALVEFQRAHGLRVDGVPGPRTLAALYPDEAATGSCGADVAVA